MRVLYVSFIKPSEKFGGGLGILQTLSALCENTEIDYVGLDFDPEVFKKYAINPRKIKIAGTTGSKIKRSFDFIVKGYSSGYYRDWENISKAIDPEDYDYVYMDHTRHSFVADWAFQYGIPLIVRAHNVEADYTSTIYENKKNIKNWIHKVLVKRSEKDCVQKAVKIIVLTDHEKTRFQKLYGEKDEKFSVIPVCVKHFECEKTFENHKPYILITGSLWFGPNADGTVWFLRNVWPELEKRYGKCYDLIIAGARPNKDILQAAQNLKCVKIFEDPEDIGPFYKGACIYIAPVFYGAGMKVKVAEALSCGLHVIATSHALTGYEASKDHMYPADDADGFINAVEEILNKDEWMVKEEKQKILEVFEDRYSIGRSNYLLKKIFENLNEVYK